MDSRSSRWLRTGVGLLATLILAGCSSSDEPATDATDPVSESPSDDPSLGEMTFTYTPGLCEQLDWSGVEAYAPFESYRDDSNDDPHGNGTGTHRCERAFVPDPTGTDYDVWLSVSTALDSSVATDGYNSNRELIEVPDETGKELGPIEGWDSSYLWAGGRRCVFFGQFDNFYVAFDLTLAVEGVDEVQQEDLVELVMDIVDEARELSRA